jgi:hypothetical protein
VPEALDDAALLERIDSAIADGRRLLAELDQLRAVLAARIPAEPEILAAADDDDADFRPHLMLWPSEAAQRFGLAVDTDPNQRRFNFITPCEGRIPGLAG